ncbi:MAG: hypothetical protein HRF50_01480 [Phycisphaerae bacterium]
MSPWFEVFGRLHPLVLHLPIGLLVGLALVEAAQRLLRTVPASRAATGALAWAAAATALLAAASGLVLSYEPGYGGPGLTWHLALGVSLAICSVFVALLHGGARPRTGYLGLLALTLLLMLPTGHLGASMTHGENFLFAPLARSHARAADPGSAGREADASESRRPRKADAIGRPIAEPTEAERILSDPAFADADRVFEIKIAPILAGRCVSCHGTDKRKGDLSLLSLASLLHGGEDGPVIAPGRPEESELVRRIRLPLDDVDHMPPEEKPQLTSEEIEQIEAWVASLPRGAAAASQPARAEP